MNPETETAIQRACDPTSQEPAQSNPTPPKFPSEERDALFDTNIAQAALFYLGDHRKDPTMSADDIKAIMSTSSAEHFLVPDIELQKAFLYGYASAAHKGHMVHPALFLRGPKLLEYVEHEVKGALSLADTTCMLETTGLKQEIRQYLLDVNDVCYQADQHLTPAFLAGYRTFFICNSRYDRSLLLQGYTLHNEVLSSMIVYQEAEYNASRATARIVMHKFTKEHHLHNHQRINDDGQPVDESGRPISSTQPDNPFDIS